MKRTYLTLFSIILIISFFIGVSLSQYGVPGTPGKDNQIPPSEELCKLGSSQCSGNILQKCVDTNSDGKGDSWAYYQTCDYGCKDGKCLSKPTISVNVQQDKNNPYKITVQAIGNYEGGVYEIVISYYDNNENQIDISYYGCNNQPTCTIIKQKEFSKKGTYKIRVEMIVSRDYGIKQTAYETYKVVDVGTSSYWLKCDSSRFGDKIKISSNTYYCCRDRYLGFYWSNKPCRTGGGSGKYKCCNPENEKVICECLRGGKLIKGSCKPITNPNYVCKNGYAVEALKVKVLNGDQINVSSDSFVSIKIMVENVLNKPKNIKVNLPEIKISNGKLKWVKEKMEKEGVMKEIKGKMFKEIFKKPKQFTFEPHEIKEFNYTVYIPLLTVGTRINLNFTAEGSFAYDDVTLLVTKGVYPIIIDATAFKYVDQERVIVSDSPVYAYVCEKDVEYCDEGAPWIIKNSTVTDEDGRFHIEMYPILELGKTYKIGVVTEEGYAETEVTIKE